PRKILLMHAKTKDTKLGTLPVIHHDVSMLMTADLHRPINLYSSLIISSTRRFLIAGSSLPTVLSFNNPTITSKTLFTLLRNFVSSLRASSVSEICLNQEIATI